LTRPQEVGIDDPEQPYVLEDLFEIMGAQPVSYPYSVECCGSYNTVNYRRAVIDRTYQIVNSARTNGAEALVLSCPLCDFNLDEVQKDTKEVYPDFTPMPVFYFTQLLALSMGIEVEDCGFDHNYTNPSSLLEKYKLIEEPISRRVLT
jgi:heterodisulfide reductase subunit B